MSMSLDFNIRTFRGDHAFLSNFYPCVVVLDAEAYPTVEHAYQAAKTLDPIHRAAIMHAGTAGVAKRLGRAAPMREGWDGMKLSVMEQLLRQKFALEPLRHRLLATAPRLITECNTWGDVYWGVCRGRGANHLGRLLMQLRREMFISPESVPPRVHAPAPPAGAKPPSTRRAAPRTLSRRSR